MERLWKGVGTGSQEEKVVQEGGSYHEAQAADKASKMRMELIDLNPLWLCVYMCVYICIHVYICARMCVEYC